MDRLEITWKALGLLSFFCSATLRVSGQLPPDPFWLVFDAPTDVRIAGEGLEFGVVGVLLSELGGDEGADGWSISIAAQGCRIASATTSSTAGDVEENGGLRKARDGFEHTELTTGEGNEGVVSAVTLAFTEKVTLPPEGSPHTIVRLGVEAIVPGGLAVGECTPCTLSYTDGLVGSGQPVDNKVAFRNQTFRPFLVPATVEVCVAESNQIPGDIDQDGDADISDAIRLFGFLFLANPRVLPCGDGNVDSPSSTLLADWNGDGRVNLSDTVALLLWMFGRGSPHSLGTSGNESTCVPIEGCSSVCR